MEWLADGRAMEGAQFWNTDGKGGYAPGLRTGAHVTFRAGRVDPHRAYRPTSASGN